jgi:hypothetical protein
MVIRETSVRRHWLLFADFTAEVFLWWLKVEWCERFSSFDNALRTSSFFQCRIPGLRVGERDRCQVQNVRAFVQTSSC